MTVSFSGPSSSAASSATSRLRGEDPPSLCWDKSETENDEDGPSSRTDAARRLSIAGDFYSRSRAETSRLPTNGILSLSLFSSLRFPFSISRKTHFPISRGAARREEKLTPSSKSTDLISDVCAMRARASCCKSRCKPRDSITGSPQPRIADPRASLTTRPVTPQPVI